MKLFTRQRSALEKQYSEVKGGREGGRGWRERGRGGEGIEGEREGRGGDGGRVGGRE